ncbi:MAG: lipid-A-disaccharide synthase [Planctomycetota bacterium]
MALYPKCDLFVLVGETSGDAYAAAVLRRLRRLCPDVVCAAMGGPQLQAAGAEVEAGIDGLAVMGFLPVLRRLPEFALLGRRIAGLIRARRPRVVLSIDYPGFNLRMMRALADLRAEGTRLVHVVAPQVWAWRPRRAKRIAQTVDRLLCFFPFEPPLFARHGVQADFVGHPLVDLVGEGARPRAVERELGLGANDRLLLLAPGSREREVAALLPVFDAAAELALPRLRPAPGGKVRVAVSRVGELPREHYRRATELPVIEDDYRSLCLRAHCGLVASGTATLEAALLGLPHIIAYRGDHLSAVLTRHLIRTEHVGLPNIVHKARVLPELLQDECTPSRLAARLIGMWEGEGHRSRRVAMARTADLLGGGGAMDRIAAAVAEELARGRRPADSFGTRTDLLTRTQTGV